MQVGPSPGPNDAGQRLNASVHCALYSIHELADEIDLTMKAIWNDTVLAESDDTKVVEGNHYFPPQSINGEHLEESDTEYTCPWKGKAEHYDVVVDDQRSEDAAWSYPEPKEAAREIKDHVAFYSDRVQVTD